MVDNRVISKLKELFEENHSIVFGFLFGSRITDAGRSPEDWDFAVFWNPDLDFWEKLGLVEDLRIQLAETLEVSSDQVDLVDLNRAGLSIASSVVEDGIPLKGEGALVLERFFQRVWALEEDFYWRLTVENRRISG